MSEEENNEMDEELTQEELEMYDKLRFALNNLNNSNTYDIIAEKYRNELLKLFIMPTQQQFIKKLERNSLRFIDENLVRSLFEALDYKKYHLFDILTTTCDTIEITMNGYITYEISFMKRFTITKTELAKVKLNYNEMSDNNKANVEFEIGEIQLDKDITTFYKTLLQFLSRFTTDP
jgi:hypothetical protein